ncbi:hypothetical protein M378DRAFT_188689 [Amanita muscaria Koide BX008]|uniref:Uncharacterized protein n=1 Tax=Amanita muscaria (strain Koide BX008) TaxID=946122 RepID=A0A0C2W1T9_AMAMK|nr:hypothetical protein M378DRAFT_188689 [Amanita muscaria Koide BX008]
MSNDQDEQRSNQEVQDITKKWNSGVYAFFKPTPTVEYDAKGQRIHVFECVASPCRSKGKNQKFVRRSLGTRDATSTSNLRKHAIICWGQETVEAASKAKSLSEARTVVDKVHGNVRDGSLIFKFERMGKGKPTYSHRPPTKLEIHAAHVLWMAESKCSFTLINDQGYKHVMKSGRLEHYIPSWVTLSRDVQKAFVHCWQKIAGLLQSHDGKLNFAVDAWTSPNYRALVAVTVHFKKEGCASTWLLDIVEVAESHTGLALAKAFSNIMKNFGISKKVWI